MKANTIALVLLSLASPNSYGEIKSVHCPLGCPSLTIPNNTVVFTHTYALSINKGSKLADWVAYEVNITNFGPSPGRNWDNNALIDENATLEKKDYKAANSHLKVDKGHQAPLAAFAGSDYWYELNYLSNITPQKSDLNQGTWRDLESAVRTAVSYNSSLFVITGPLYNDTINNPTLPKADEEHLIPDAYFKIIYNLKGESAPFLMNQETPKGTEFCSKKATISKIKSDIAFELPLLVESDELYAQLGCNE